jgi:hypothetical protein
LDQPSPDSPRRFRPTPGFHFTGYSIPEQRRPHLEQCNEERVMFVRKISLLTVVAALLPALAREQEADTALTRIQQNKAVN